MSNSNSSGRRHIIPPPEERPEILRNPNQPENDIGVGGAVGGAGGVRLRDENALSFRHFLQPQSDLIPQPAPTRCRGNRGGVDLVEATMALPDFVQDHLVLESAASAAVVEPSQDMSPSRPHPHALDLNALNEILLPDLGSSSSSQRSSTRNPTPLSRRTDRDHSDISGTDIPGASGGGSALPDFLSDGPMQLNHSGSGGDPNSNGSGGDLGVGGVSRSRAPQPNSIFPEEPVRGPSFESKESLRLQIDRLRAELAEKNRKINQLETDLSSQRSVSSNLESSLRVAERNLKRATEAEAQLSRNVINPINGHAEGLSPQDDSDSGIIANIARSSENLIGQLLQNMTELKKISENQSKSKESKSKSSGDDNVKPPRST